MKKSTIIIAIVITVLTLTIVGLSLGLVYVLTNRNATFSSKNEEKTKDFTQLAKEFGDSFGNEADLRKFFNENIDYETIAAINLMTFESAQEEEIIAEFKDAQTKITEQKIEEGKSAINTLIDSYVEYTYFGTPLEIKNISDTQDVKFVPMLKQKVVTYEYGDGNEASWIFMLYEDNLIILLSSDIEDAFLSAFRPTPENFVKNLVVKANGSKDDYINYMVMNVDLKQYYVTDTLDRSDVNYSKVTDRASYNDEMTKAAERLYNGITEDELKDVEEDFKESCEEDYDEFLNAGIKIKSIGQLQNNKFFPFLDTLYVTLETEDGTETYDLVFNFYDDKFVFFEDQENYEDGVAIIERYLDSL